MDDNTLIGIGIAVVFGAGAGIIVAVIQVLRKGAQQRHQRGQR